MPLIPIIAVLTVSVHAGSTLIQGGTLYNGFGAAPVVADVRIQGERVVAIGKLERRPGETLIDAKGLAVAPGFIDAHSHADGGARDRPLLESQIRQGITTAVVGQDGGGKSPLSDLFDGLAKAHPTLNFAAFAGHGAIRESVMGNGYKRPATPAEIDRMKGLLAADMKAGALGLSTGLEYDPGFYSTTEELIELAKVAARHGGMYISHVRDEGNDAMKSFEEVRRISREAGLPAQISHIKLGTASVWGRTASVLEMLKASQGGPRSERISADVYPYTYWQSTITVLTLDRNWDDRKVWERALADVGGAGHVLLSTYSPDPAWVGKTLEEIAAMTGKDAISIIQEIIRKTHGPEGKGSESIVCTAMDEDDLRAWIRSPQIMFCSDGSDGGSHPRSAGSFPRILGHYVRELRLLPLQEAIRKMTTLPARTFGLANRGKITVGSFADVVVFDPKTIVDLATAKNPKSHARGVIHVWVNGSAVLKSGRLTGNRPGSVLRRTRPLF